MKTLALIYVPSSFHSLEQAVQQYNMQLRVCVCACVCDDGHCEIIEYSSYSCSTQCIT